MPGFFDVTLGALVGSSIATAVLGALFLRRNKTVESEIKAHFDKSVRVFESTRTWKEKALSELFGPLQMQFERTHRAFRRWNRKNLYLEASVVRSGNEAIRNLLLEKGHLIPPYLMDDAVQLVEHYDAWLEKYEAVRGDAAVRDDVDFVFVGPDGYGFPGLSEQNFKKEFRRLQQELYGV